MTDKNNKPSQHQLMQALQAAHQFHAAGQFSDAERLCGEILAVLPKQADAIHLLGVMALTDGNIDKAVNYFERAIKQDPKNPQFYCNLGLAFHEQGFLSEAANNYRKAITLDVRYTDAYYNLHAVLINNKDFSQSISCLQQVLKLNPYDTEAQLMLGILLDYSKQYEPSVTLLQKLSNISPLMDARLDAWHYFKSLSHLPSILGSGFDVFKRAVSAADVKGMVLEFGVRHGKSIKQIVKLVGQEVHGFDSFQGLPEAWHKESKGSYSTKGLIPKVPPKVKLHAGWFDESLPEFLESHPEPVRLMNIDCDIYSSTKTVLTILAPQIVVGSVIVFDEYMGNEHWREDEFKAFQEAVSEHGWQYEYLCISFFTKQVVVRITEIKPSMTLS
ncbi:MAG: tetratricopeptide repeat protein [Methylophilaceae bacterium]